MTTEESANGAVSKRGPRKARGARRGNAVGIRPGIEPGAVVFERGDHVELAGRVLERLQRPDRETDEGQRVPHAGPPLPVTYDVGRVWRYDPGTGIWSAIEEEHVEDTAAGFAGAPLLLGKAGVLMVNASTVKGTRHVLRARLLSEPGRLSFGQAPNGMAFANGFVVVEGGKIEVLPHSPTRLARWRYDFDYDPLGSTEKLRAFLLELFFDVTDEDERARRIALLQEFLGACLVGDATRYQRYLILFAGGGNGKSELLRLCRSCFPPGTVTSIEPQKWADDRHVAALEGARANFVDELPDNEIMGGHNVKRVITGEPITARRVYQDAITFPPRVGHMFATNVPVQSSDYSDGFWERPLVIVLSRKFRKSKARRLEAAKSVIASELPGLVAWAIEGARRAQEQRGYTEPASSTQTLLEWRDDNDQIRGYFADEPITGRWSADTLYNNYREWAKRNGCAIMSSAKFGRRVVANELARRGRDGNGRFYMPFDATAGAGVPPAEGGQMDAGRDAAGRRVLDHVQPVATP